ncbi:tRNA (cytidine/uridine-2'-O-)-methyltransferase [Mesorhizobium australicum]|uniref:tRNA (cytidine(34)-2'-O)-methyltransferase n=2 Tax=Mesorhizobium australicum TaxID=536018 RepID=A0A1X7PKJ6_9HYPH|nr:tRNA (cytidine/uridine-2'-O-)-methyltransferase [Mesorhizobium australicum]
MPGSLTRLDLNQSAKSMTHDLHIALYQPEIPGNTGAILRLAACFSATVDIIRPIGFELSDRTLKRAGMDYLEIAAIREHADFAAFEDWRRQSGRRLVLMSTKAERAYTDFAFRPDDVLMLGRESSGVPDSVHALADAELRIPIRPEARSLNLGMSAAITLSEAVRQIGRT